MISVMVRQAFTRGRKRRVYSIDSFMPQLIENISISLDSLSNMLKNYFTGTTIKHLSGKSLAKIQVLLPSVMKQEQIIGLLDKMILHEQQAKDTAEQVVAQIDTMKKSILARAFRGELGTNDPSDESADELLKRIL